MPTKGLVSLTFVAGVALTGVAFAQAPAHGSFFGPFDLKSAVLSPMPLGPPSRFEPQAETQPVEKPQVEAAQPQRNHAASRKQKPQQKLAAPARKPKSNPLDSYARDQRRQLWPCLGDGICAWTQPR